MRRPIIELSNPLIEKELFSRVGFLSFAEGGAMGEPGGVYFFTDDGTLYHLNLMHEDFPYDQFAEAFPVIDQCDFGPFGYDSQVPEGWNYVNLGVGNHLLVADRWYEKFIDIVGEDVFPGYMYQTWMLVADQILGNEGGRVSVTREDRIRVFEDTLYWIEDDEDLVASVKKAKKNTQVFFENDYPAFDATINRREVITVTGNKSYQAAMELAKENPGVRIAVLNFANAFIPGGGVRKGAGAQEECLCRCSTLYPLLYRRTLRDTFYRHHKDLNSSRASDSMIYTEGVIV